MKPPKAFKLTPQTGVLFPSISADALMIEPWVMDHAAARMLVLTIIALGSSSDNYTPSSVLLCCEIKRFHSRLSPILTLLNPLYINIFSKNRAILEEKKRETGQLPEASALIRKGLKGIPVPWKNLPMNS